MPRQADIDEANKQENKLDVKEKGMNWERSCTDIFCCLVFIAFLVVMVGVSFIGFSKGDPMKIATPFDSVGNGCGNKTLQGGYDGYASATFTSDFTEYKYKYFSNIQIGSTSTIGIFDSVCVKECPKMGSDAVCIVNNDVRSCPTATFDSTPLASFCVPEKDDAKALFKVVYQKLSEYGNFGSYIADIQLCWKGMAAMAGVTFVISIVYIFLLKWITKPLLYISMVLILAMFILLGGWCWIKRGEYDPETQKDNLQYATIGAVVSWVIAGLYLCFMCCCFKQIAFGASIMECASEFVSQNLRIITLPVIAYIFSFVFLLFWVVTAVYVYSIGDVYYNPNNKLPIADIKWDEQTRYIMWFFFFCLFWVVAFFICLQQFMIAAMSCMWYFSGQGADMSDQPGTVSMLKAMHWGTWYHCGSIAFGSFIIAVITMIRVVFEYMAKQYEMANKENPVVKVVACCVRCVLWCLDKYVKFITKNAFIQIALNNKNFCSAAWTSFWLIIRNAGRFGSATIIGWIMMMLGKGTIMSTSGYLTFLLVNYQFPDVQQPFIPAIIIALFAYLVGSLFLSIFSFSCTAILHCFLLDEETGGAKTTPESLKSFLDYNDKENAGKADEAKEEKQANKMDAEDEKKEDDTKK